jgi:hypothetical protein
MASFLYRRSGNAKAAAALIVIYVLAVLVVSVGYGLFRFWKGIRQ